MAPNEGNVAQPGREPMKASYVPKKECAINSSDPRGASCTTHHDHEQTVESQATNILQEIPVVTAKHRGEGYNVKVQGAREPAPGNRSSGSIIYTRGQEQKKRQQHLVLVQDRHHGLAFEDN